MISFRRATMILLCTAATTLAASCGGDSGSPSAADLTSTPAAKTSQTADRRLPEGTYSTGELTRPELIAAGVAGKLTVAQAEAALELDGIDEVATFTIKIQANRLTQFYDYDHSNDQGVGYIAIYQVIDDDTLTATEACCGTTRFEYTFDNDKLQLQIAGDPQEICHGDVGCNMGVIVFESAPFTRID